MFSKQTYLAFALLMAVLGTAHAQTQADPSKPVKTYTLTDLDQAVENIPSCKAFYQDLETLTQKPFSLQFTKQDGEGVHAVQHLHAPIQNHIHTTLKQTAEGGIVHRVSAGSFEMTSGKFDYILSVSANLNNPDHRYLYPIILTSENESCHYFALLKPSDETVATFKKNISSQAVVEGMDLHKH